LQRQAGRNILFLRCCTGTSAGITILRPVTLHRTPTTNCTAHNKLRKDVINNIFPHILFCHFFLQVCACCVRYAGACEKLHDGLTRTFTNVTVCIFEGRDQLWEIHTDREEMMGAADMHES
jgi:hypothetical protein